jgi:hypothetical protein
LRTEIGGYTRAALADQPRDILHQERAWAHPEDEPGEFQDEVIPPVFVCPDALYRESLARRAAGNQIDWLRQPCLLSKRLDRERANVGLDDGMAEVQTVGLDGRTPGVERSHYGEAGLL